MTQTSCMWDTEHPKSAVTDDLQDEVWHWTTLNIPRTTHTDNIPERTNTDNIPERTNTDNIPQRTNTDNIPQRTNTDNIQPVWVGYNEHEWHSGSSSHDSSTEVWKTNSNTRQCHSLSWDGVQLFVVFTVHLEGKLEEVSQVAEKLHPRRKEQSWYMIPWLS